MANIVSTQVQIGKNVFQVEGRIEGETASTMTVTVTKVTLAGVDVTSFWTSFEDSQEIEDSLRKAYVNSLLDGFQKTIVSFQSQLEGLFEQLETSKRLLLNT